MKFRALLAEFIGTFALIFVGVLAVYHLAGPAALIGIALAHGLTIACLASATAAISGGHLNPAVTVAFMLTGRIDVLNGFGYIASQLLGAVAAAYAAAFLMPAGDPTLLSGTVPALAEGFTSTQGLVAESIATFFLVFVILGTAVDRRAPKMGALFIGLAVMIGIFAIGPFTGAALNPARWFGPALVSHSGLLHPLVFIGGPLLGGAVAALIYKFLLEDKAPIPPDSAIRVDEQPVAA